VQLTAVEFALFTHLGERRRTAEELGAELQLHPALRFGAAASARLRLAAR
jgi:hypothetical protein